ncbi:MAG: threonine aldolase, partial [Coriobacteriia bacterium]|nr:threonine aldolase [Coriobacteriia bacterium]
YIGGTKNGALLGEAIVICHPDLKPDFRFYLKQNGTLLGKSAVIGIEFKTLMADGLYDQLAAHAVSLGQKLSEGLARLGYDFFCPTETNQVFPILPNPTLAKIRELYHFLDWQPLGDQTAVRLIASWATEEERIDEFLDDLAAITHRPE